jgi:ABC-type dipeptide/oligopeptide/nickel transport system permease component
LWLGILLAWLFGIVLGWFPIAGAYSFNVAGLLQRGSHSTNPTVWEGIFKWYDIVFQRAVNLWLHD